MATAEREGAVVELAIGRILVRVRGQVDADALRRVLDVLEARA